MYVRTYRFSRIRKLSGSVTRRTIREKEEKFIESSQMHLSFHSGETTRLLSSSRVSFKSPSQQRAPSLSLSPVLSGERLSNAISMRRRLNVVEWYPACTYVRVCVHAVKREGGLDGNLPKSESWKGPPRPTSPFPLSRAVAASTTTTTVGGELAATTTTGTTTTSVQAQRATTAAVAAPNLSGGI